MGRDGAICLYGRDRATHTLGWVLGILFASSTLHVQSWWDLGVPAPAPRAGRAPFVPLGTPGCPVPRALLGLPSGLNQTERPVLHLAVAHRDDVVGLWQSPERSSEGWHQLVAYPGRITEQFQVRQCQYLGTVPIAGTYAGGAGGCSGTLRGLGSSCHPHPPITAHLLPDTTAHLRGRGGT